MVGLTYRVRLSGSPLPLDKLALITVLQKVLDMNDEHRPRIRSLVSGIPSNEQVATVDSNEQPRRLKGAHQANQWSFELDNASVGERELRITVDTHFRGLTPLFAEEHTSTCE